MLERPPAQAGDLEPARGGAAAGRARALLVGINEYRHQPLRGCVNDVGDVAEFLRSHRGFPAASIRTLLDAEATRAAILRELRGLAAESRRGDSLVFYFCGHGAQLPTLDPNEADQLDEVLCPVDFDWTPATAIVDNELEEIFDAIADGVDTTWVFDACHTGDIDEALDQRVAACRALVPPHEPAPHPGLVVGSGLCRMLSRDRGVILTACASTEKAADIFVDGVARGAFSYYLMQAARSQRAAAAAEILASASESLAPIGQHPEGYGPGLGAPFIRPVESTVHSKEQPRSVTISDNSSVEADRHLHMYLAEASRKVLADPEFGSRMTELGVDLSGISPEDAAVLSRAVRPAPRSGTMTCRTFWWGFHLEIPHVEMATLAAEGVDHATLTRMIDLVPHRVAPHVKTLVDFVVANFESACEIDRGAGVFISMSSFAPDLYVATAVPVRTLSARRPEREHGEPLAVRM